MEWTILVRSDQIIWDKGCPHWLVLPVRPKCPFPFNKIVVPTLVSRIQLKSKTIKHVVAWVRSVQPEYAVPLGMWNFQNFKPDLFLMVTKSSFFLTIRYPFTPDQVVQEADWEVYLKETAQQIVEQQTPKRLVDNSLLTWTSQGWKKAWIPACPWGKQLSGSLFACLNQWFTCN